MTNAAHTILRGLLLVALSGLFAAASPATRAVPAKTYLTPEEALELAFPECEVERETVYLTKEQKRAVEKLSGFDLDSTVVWVYTAKKKGDVVGHAYFDTHKVRTKKETVMIALSPDQRISRIEVLNFAEPAEYLPHGKWYAQFRGQRLGKGLRIKGDIRNVTGATLTARATTRAARRTLAVHRVLFGEPPPEVVSTRS